MSWRERAAAPFRWIGQKIGGAYRSVASRAAHARDYVADAPRALIGEGRPRLYYFDEVLPVEFAALAERRRNLAKTLPQRAAYIERNLPPSTEGVQDPESADLAGPDSVPAARKKEGGRTASPDSEQLFRDANQAIRRRFRPTAPRSEAKKRAHRPDSGRIRPRPVPCTATGLALSGGGIRSAAICLGSLQALEKNDRIDSIDYLSTVSGGGYAGACLSAAMSAAGGFRFPFGRDVSDSPSIAHLRNFSDYLLPRGRSAIRNLGEAAAVILRGLLANAVIVSAIVLGLVLLTVVAYPDRGALGSGGLPPRIVDGALSFLSLERGVEDFLDADIALVLGSAPLATTAWLAAALATVLVAWATLRRLTYLDRFTSDTKGLSLRLARNLLLVLILVALMDLQPIAIDRVIAFHERVFLHADGSGNRWLQALPQAIGTMAGLAAGVAAFASALGRFLERSRRTRTWRTTLLRGLVRVLVFVVGMILPVLLWLTYLWLAAWAVAGWNAPVLEWRVWRPLATLIGIESPVVSMYWNVFVAATVVMAFLRPNAYSLHRFYRDRLSKAFLFKPPQRLRVDPEELDGLKLSELRNTHGPYHIINAAMNVQGSVEANRRGRNADFFMFTNRFVGSDLTLYTDTDSGALAATRAMEDIDTRLDLATAMAISGAAVSANMGSSTIRALSPTLALLNIRLGYWLSNPRDLAARTPVGRGWGRFWRTFREKFYLLAEMMNLHDETSREVYLTDGGHIENLGLYELLKRGCRLIIVVDAEADPEMTFSSLLKVERYARIDLGIRIVLPWEAIADAARETEAGIVAGSRPCRSGPHCAVGRILYEDGAEGTLVYFKSSLTGDEKDYILDYKVRNPKFPHETTGDQFFTEEQFEMYRALGFHMVDGFFTRDDRFSYLTRWTEGFNSPDEVWAEIDGSLPAARLPREAVIRGGSGGNRH